MNERNFTHFAGKPLSISKPKEEQREPVGAFPVIVLITPVGNPVTVGRLLHHLLPSPDMAYVIVEYVPYDEADGHLNGESVLPRLLEGRTKMPVNPVTPNMQ